MDAGPTERGARCRPEARRRRPPRTPRGSGRPRRRRRTRPCSTCVAKSFGRDRCGLAVDEREDLAPPGVDHRERARRAGRERVERRDARDRDAEREGERPGRGEAHAQAREAPGAGADDDPAESRPPARRASRRSGIDVLEHARRARAVRSPSTSPSSTSAPWPRRWPCQTRGSARLDRDRPAGSVTRHGSGRTRTPTRSGSAAPGGLRPLDEADRVVEIRLEVAPLRRRHALEAVEVEVGHVASATVAMADRVGRAGHRPVDAERAAGAADEGRLPGAELARDRDDVARARSSARKPAAMRSVSSGEEDSCSMARC